MLRHRVVLAVILLLLLNSAVFSGELVPITYQGMLKDSDGNPVPDGNYDFEVKIYDDPTGSDPIWVDSFFDVFVELGRLTFEFAPDVDSIKPIMWLELVVEGETLGPRQKITRAPSSGSTMRVDGDILTAPGLIELVPPEPCEPPPCPQSVIFKAAPDTTNIILNNGDGTNSSSIGITSSLEETGIIIVDSKPDIGVSSIGLNTGASEKGIIIVDSKPTGDSASIGITSGAEETGIIIVDSKITEGLSSIGLTAGAAEKGIIIVDSKPTGDSASIGITSGAEETGIIIVDSKPTEGSSSSIDMSTGGDEEGIIIINNRPDGSTGSIGINSGLEENGIIIVNTMPVGYGDSSAVELTTGEAGALLALGIPQTSTRSDRVAPFLSMQTQIGGEASIKMFQPQPEPPGFPSIELETDGVEHKSSFVMFNPQPEPPGSEPDIFLIMKTLSNSASIRMFQPQPEPPGHAFMELYAEETGGVLNLSNEIGQYMGIEPSPFHEGGSLKLYQTLSTRSEILGAEVKAEASGGEIILNDALGNIGTHITPGGMEMSFRDPTGGSGPPVHMQTYPDVVRVGIGTNTPDTELHIIGHIKIEDGDEADGKVLTSDANGVGYWEDPLYLANSRVEELLNKIEQLEARIAELEAERR